MDCSSLNVHESQSNSTNPAPIPMHKPSETPITQHIVMFNDILDINNTTKGVQLAVVMPPPNSQNT